jgi:hypothetical protein
MELDLICRISPSSPKTNTGAARTPDTGTARDAAGRGEYVLAEVDGRVADPVG